MTVLHHLNLTGGLGAPASGDVLDGTVLLEGAR
jgi:hypothetical protein